MKIAITGSSGLIGRALVNSLTESGHTVMRLVRHSTVDDRNVIGWDPTRGLLDSSSLEGVDGIIHLAGENLASGRWTKQKKQSMYRSRVDSAKLLCNRLLDLQKRPKVYISASGIGFYGDRGNEELTERSSKGTGFLADLCDDWEGAATPLVRVGIRVVNLRLGMVLAKNGGALDRMLPPFKLGLGGRLGSGYQFWSWVSIRDVIRVIDHCLTNDNLSGPINMVAPNPLTNREFTKILARLLKRPSIFPVPSFALKLGFGKMAVETILASTRALPEKLQESGFTFSDPELEEALRQLLDT